MQKKSVNIKKLLSEYLKNRTTPVSEYAQIASEALEKTGFRNIIIFDCDKQLVMINMNSSIKAIASGLILNEEETEIVSFKNSEDYKSVTVNALARHLILESIDNETDILRLRTLSKNQHSWIIHYITNESSKKSELNAKPGTANEYYYPSNMCNAHTHGLKAFTHKDFQIVLDIGRENTVFLLNAMAERVRDGETFSDGERVKGIYDDCEIKLASVKEGNREVLRILIPDSENRFPGDDNCAYPYSEQERVIK